MALTDAQKLSIKELLGLPITSTVLDTRFTAVDADAALLARATALVAKYDAIADQDTALSAKGFSKRDVLTKATLRRNMALLMGIEVGNAIVRLS